MENLLIYCVWSDFVNWTKEKDFNVDKTLYELKRFRFGCLYVYLIFTNLSELLSS